MRHVNPERFTAVDLANSAPDQYPSGCQRVAAQWVTLSSGVR